MTHISDLLAGGQVYSGGIKGYERMQNKLKSFTDHWNSDIPRCVCVCVRACVRSCMRARARVCARA